MNNFPERPHHPSDDILVRFIDGELELKDAAAVREHLEACWACRADVEEIQWSIRHYIRFHQKRITSPAARPPREWRDFNTRLWHLEDSLRTGSQRPHAGGFEQLREIPFRAAWMAGAFATALIILLFIGMGHSNKLSAMELLQKSIRSESSESSRGNHRVRIRYRDHSFSRVPGDDTRTVAMDSNSASDVKRLLEENQLDWAHPLSARAFERWHDHLREKTDEVTRFPDRYRLRTITYKGLLRRADFEVHASDFHPLQESLDFGEEGVVEITEIEDAEPVLSKSEPPRPVTPLIRRPHVRTLTSEPSIDDSEAKVRMLLHTIGADLQDAVVIHQTGNSIELTGIVNDASRKAELMEQIGNVDGRIHIHVQSAEEAAADTASTIIKPSVSAAKPNFDPPAKAWLEKRYPDPIGREQFVEQAFQLSRNASIRAYALTQLAERYSPVSFNALSPESRVLISRIISDHAIELEKTWAALREHIEPLTGPISPGPNIAEDWQSSAQSCAAATRTADNVLSRLLAESSESGPPFADLVRQLRAALADSCHITPP